jgi:PhnB protein
MARIVAYLAFDGNCREAMEFYRACLGGELRLMTAGETPMGSQMPPEQRDKIMHAELRLGDILLMASDNLQSPGSGVTVGDAVFLMLACESEGEIKAYFEALSKGGKVSQALGKQFWGATYGDLTDKFGLRWMLNWEPPKT